MTRADNLHSLFVKAFSYEPTESQLNFLRVCADFLCSDEGDILVVRGYAGTGKTYALSVIVGVLKSLKLSTSLLAPTGRAAKVLSSYAYAPASTIHKAIYRQKSFSDDGFGQFSLAPNKSRGALFIVDEASLIGIDAAQSTHLGFGSGNLLEDLVSYVRSAPNCRLILSGDMAQLPPVGMDESPALSEDYMGLFGGVSFVELTDVVRQALDSGILMNATALRRDLEAGSFRFSLKGYTDIERVSQSELIESISSSYGLYGEEETVVLCRSNKRAIRYNLGIRSTIQFKEERLLRGDRLLIVKNCYQFLNEGSSMGYIANGDTCALQRIGGYEERYGLHFADAVLRFPDYDDETIHAKVCLDTLESEAPALTYGQQDALYKGVSEDYADIASKKKRYEAVREDPFYNALQLKYSYALTAHKAQGGQWCCVYIDFPFWGKDFLAPEDLKWLYTALTRAREKVFLVGFPDEFFE